MTVPYIYSFVDITTCYMLLPLQGDIDSICPHYPGCRFALPWAMCLLPFQGVHFTLDLMTLYIFYILFPIGSKNTVASDDVESSDIEETIALLQSAF